MFFWMILIAVAIFATRKILGTSDAKPEEWEQRENAKDRMSKKRVLSYWDYDENISAGVLAALLRIVIDPFLRRFPWGKLNPKGNLYKFYGVLYLIHGIAFLSVVALLFVGVDAVALGYLCMVLILWRFTLFYHARFPRWNFPEKAQAIHKWVNVITSMFVPYILIMVLPVALPYFCLYSFLFYYCGVRL